MDEIAQIPQRRDTFIPADIASGVFAFLAKKYTKYTVDIDEIYNRFHKLSQKYTDVFVGFYFYESGKGFNSKELEDIINQMITWGLLTTDSPRYKVAHIDSASINPVIDILNKRYSVEMFKQLEKLAEEFETIQ